MNKEEIKQSNSMKDIIARYNLFPNRAGFIKCPFHHGDNTASMKIYEDSFYCFGCGAAGDIFGFVQRIENISFKEAYMSLGGTYEKPTFSSKLAIYRSQKHAKTRIKAEIKLRKEKELNHMLIGIYQKYIQCTEPLSDVWCECYNALQIELYKHSILNGLESRW